MMSMTNPEVSEQLVLVTGGARGLGLAITNADGLNFL